MSQILQDEFALTQVLDKPQHGRLFFEKVIRENLGLGRPDQVQLIFDRKIIRTSPAASTPASSLGGQALAACRLHAARQLLLRDGQLDRGVDDAEARALLIGRNDGANLDRAASVRRMAYRRDQQEEEQPSHFRTFFPARLPAKHACN